MIIGAKEEKSKGSDSVKTNETKLDDVLKYWFGFLDNQCVIRDYIRSIQDDIDEGSLNNSSDTLAQEIIERSYTDTLGAKPSLRTALKYLNARVKFR